MELSRVKIDSVVQRYSTERSCNVLSHVWRSICLCRRTKRITHIERGMMDRPRRVDRDVECICWSAHASSDPKGSSVNRSLRTVRKMMSKLYELETASNCDQILADHLGDCTSARIGRRNESTHEHTVRGLIRSRKSAAMNQNSCIAVTTHVRNSEGDQKPSDSKRKTNDRNLQRSECWRIGVVGHAGSLRANILYGVYFLPRSDAGYHKRIGSCNYARTTKLLCRFHQPVHSPLSDAPSPEYVDFAFSGLAPTCLLQDIRNSILHDS